MTQLVDYAWTKPTPAQIVAGGYAGVLRYLSWDSSKDISAAERDALHAAGLSIGLVWETTATRAGAGYAAGVADVTAAEAKATALGYPTNIPLFYAVDFDALVAAVLPYFQGVLASSHYPVGVYGSANVVEGIPAPWKWQTVAWSKGRISAQAHLYQTTLPTLPACDLNKVLRPVPLWFPTIPPQEDTMSTFIQVKGSPTVYLTDGITARAVPSNESLANLAWLAAQGLYRITQPAAGEVDAVNVGGVRVRVVADPGVLGKVL